MKNKQTPVFATDLGGVVFVNGAHTQIPGAFKALRRLVAKFGQANSHVISRVNDIHGTMRSKKRLENFQFCTETGMCWTRLHYCYRRDEKGPIAKELGVTHMIDDRPEVLSHMDGIVPHRFLFQPNMNDFAKFEQKLSGVVIVHSWTEVEERILMGAMLA